MVRLFRPRRQLGVVLALIVVALPGCDRGGPCPPAPASGPGVSRVDLEARVTQVAAGRGAVWALRRVAREGHGRSDLVEVDPVSGQIVGRPIPLSGVGSGLDVGEGGVWVVTVRPGADAETGRGILLRVDPDSHRVLERTRVGRGPSGVAAGEGGVWVTNAKDGTVSRVDPSTGRVTATVPIGDEPGRVLAGAGGVWVQTELGRAPVRRIDPSTNRVTATLDVGLQNLGPDAVWVIGPWAPNGGLRRIDPITLRPVGPTLGFDILPASVGIAGPHLWVGKYFSYCERRNGEAPPIVSFAWFRVDPTTLRALSGPVFVGPNPGTPAFAGGAFWIAPELGSGVIRIDLARAGRVRPTPTPGLPSPATPAG